MSPEFGLSTIISLCLISRRNEKVESIDAGGKKQNGAHSKGRQEVIDPKTHTEGKEGRIFLLRWREEKKKGREGF